MSQRLELIKERLEAELTPLELKISDDSHLHVGHLGAASGGGHYSVLIVSEKFIDLNQIKRHKLIYAALGDLFPQQIHALSIKARTPEET